MDRHWNQSNIERQADCGQARSATDEFREMAAKHREAAKMAGATPSLQPATELSSLGYDLESTLEGLHAANRRLIELAERLLGPRPETDAKVMTQANHSPQTVWRLRDVANYMRASLSELHDTIGYLERL